MGDILADCMGVALCLIIALAFIAVFCNLSGQPCEYDTISTPIYSLSMGDETSGSFILGIGSVDEQPIYYFYKQNAEGLILDSEEAYYTTIIETNETAPSLVYYDITGGHCEDKITNYQGNWKILYVPEGTIKRQFSVG